MNRMLALAFVVVLAACSRTATGPSGAGTASLELDGTTYPLEDVELVMETGEEPWFHISGEPAGNPHEDCVVGLGAGLGLYGDLPSSIRRPADLVGERLRVDFSGDGDDANFCFVGMDGLAGAEDAWVTIDSVRGDRVAFSMTGTFKIYDENGEGPIKQAEARGTAVVRAAG